MRRQRGKGEKEYLKVMYYGLRSSKWSNEREGMRLEKETTLSLEFSPDFLAVAVPFLDGNGTAIDPSG